MAEWLGFPAVEKYKDLDLKDLPLNQAYVTVNTTVENVSVYGVKDTCFNCPYKLEKHFKAHLETSWQVDTAVQTTWAILSGEAHEHIARARPKGHLLCIMRPTFQEYGVYRLDVGKCEVRPVVPPVNTYLPLLLCSLILLASGIIYAAVKFVLNRRKKEAENDKSIQINMGKMCDENTDALSVFRGVLLSLIIFITTGGGGYPIFNNEWNGLSLAECIFFGFAWTVGVNIPMVMEKAFNQQTKCYIVRDIFVRAFLLTVVGTVIDSTVGNYPHPDHVTIWCPLQRIGIAYLIVASAYVLTVQKFEMKSKIIISKIIRNVISLLWCWIISGFLLALMIVLISTAISFNCLSNVNLDHREDYSAIIPEVSDNCNNDITEYINKLFVADPEKTVDINGYLGFSRGIMGIMSTIIIMKIGLKAGIVYLHYQSHSDRLKLWGFWATLFGVGGIIFAVVSHLIDFNLWPISTILLTSTSTLYFFIIIYIITEVWKINSSTLNSAGITSLAILSGHLLFSDSVPFSWQISFRNHTLYLLQNFWIVFSWFTVGVMLIKKRVKFDI